MLTRARDGVHGGYQVAIDEQDSPASHRHSLVVARPTLPVYRRPGGRLPSRSAHDRVRLPSHVERRVPVTIAVLRELEIGAVHAFGDLAHPAPVIEPAVDKGELRRRPANRERLTVTQRSRYGRLVVVRSMILTARVIR